MRRRNFLSATALMSLAGCGIVTVSGTTVTVNVAKLDAYAQAAQNAALILMPALAIVLTPAGVAAVDTGMKAVAASIAAIDKDYAGSATFSFQTGSVPQDLATFQEDVAGLWNAFSAAAGANNVNIPSGVQTKYAAFQTIYALVSEIGSMAIGAVQPAMSESAALAALGVKEPT